jgi:Uma2 family endonuclease
MTIANEPVHRFTRDEYYQMVEAGIFQEKRVERLGGEILDMPPQTHPHAWTVTVFNQFLTRQAPEGYFVRCQAPLAIGEGNDPEPDLAVIAGEATALKNHPETAALVVEVAYDSLRRDRGKVAVYASAGIPEYWIVNVRGREIVQYLNPRRVVGAETEDYEYATIRAFREGETITSATLAIPVREVSHLLPPASA